VEINLLQFADDITFMCEESLENVQVFKCVRRCFEFMSELRTNFSKRRLRAWVWTKIR